MQRISKGRGKTQAAIECFNPELLQTKEMMSYSELCKHIPNVPQSEWVRHIALPAPSPLPDSTAARVAWWDAKKDDFPMLSSIAFFFVRRPRSACHVERTFSLMGHIQTKDRLHISRGHSERANTEQIRNFSGFSHVLVHRGGVCVCFSKSVRKGRFRNVWVGGG